MIFELSGFFLLKIYQNSAYASLYQAIRYVKITPVICINNKKVMG